MHLRIILPNIKLPMGDISLAISDRASVRASSVRSVPSPSGAKRNVVSKYAPHDSQPTV